MIRIPVNPTKSQAKPQKKVAIKKMSFRECQDSTPNLRIKFTTIKSNKMARSETPSFKQTLPRFCH